MILNIFLFITNMMNVILEFKNKSVSLLIWGVLFLLFTIPHILIYDTGQFSINTLNKAAIFVCLFNLIYFFSRIILNKNKFNLKKDLFKLKKINEERNYINLFCYLYIISVIILIYGIMSKGYSFFYFTWSDGLYYKGTFFERIAKQIIITFGGIGFIVFSIKNKYKFLIVFIFYILYLFLFKSRYDIIPFISPFIIFYIYSQDLKKVSKAIIISLLVVFFVFMLQQIRYAGGIRDLINNYTFNDIIRKTYFQMTIGKGEFSLFKVFYYFIENNNNFENFEEGKTYIRLLLLPFPSKIFYFKPRDFAMDMWEAYVGIETTVGTSHPTLYGDVYANFGFLGIFMGIIYAIFVKFIDNLLKKLNSDSIKVLYVSIFSTMYILLGRGAVYNSIANAFWSLVFINIIIFVSRIRF